MVKLKEKKSISVNDLKDGQIAEIICFPGQESKHGLIVQRHDRWLIAVGQRSGKTHGSLIGSERSDDVLVRVLEEGESLIIVNNQ